MSGLAHIPLLAQAEDAPAGGAETGEAIIVTIAAAIVTVVLLGPLLLYKAGRFPLPGKLADLAERVTRLPGWAALPGTFLAVTLLIAVFGMYWDISLHIDDGRDPGPLANPAHYFILAGLFGVLLAGVLGMALPRKRTRTSLEIAPGWHVPVGALIIAVCGAASLSAFPLDDVWHRIFGQDVTLWGPTHLMLIGGASLSVLGAWALHVEGDEERRAAGRPLPWWTRARETILAGAFLVALSTFQAEFDFSVPQFSLLLQPILIMLAAGVALVAARIRIGPGGALAAVLVFGAIRGLLALLVGPLFDQTVPSFPLYLAEALVVEAIGFLWLRGRPAAERPIGFGALCGLGIGTIGLAGEWAWNQGWVVNEWPASLFPEGAILGFLAALAGGVVGGFVGRTLTPGVVRTERMPRASVPLAAALGVAVVAFAIPAEKGSPVSASFQLSETEAGINGGQRAVTGIVRLDPPDAAEGAWWFQATSWQGGDPSIVQQLEEVGPGTYRIAEPIPVDGNWKTTLRLHEGRRIAGLPIFMPEDSAIPAEEVPAQPTMTREFVLDKENLQRELKDDVPGWLTLAAYLFVGALSFGLIALVAWGLARLERLGGGPPDESAEPAGVGPAKKVDEEWSPTPATS
ncbi:MAG: hypothetical protein ACRDL6_01825 [Solirubrobacterales bacterium]